MPAVLGSGNPFKGLAVFDGRDALVLCPVAPADIDGTAGANNAHLPASALFLCRFFFRYLFVICRDLRIFARLIRLRIQFCQRRRQRFVGFGAVLAVCLNGISLLEGFDRRETFRPLSVALMA